MPESIEPSRTAATRLDPNASAVGDRDETAAVGRPSGAPGPAFGPPAAPGEVGTLGPYRVLKELGKGGMGAVYLALDTRLDRKLALKVMRPELATDREVKERFLREAKAAAKVTHDNVVTVYEADERDGVPYIAMQFLQGYSLDQFLKYKGAPPLPHVIRIAREAAGGLAAAHALGLVHRDVKPGNLWLEAPNGRVKVLDFGLAKPVGADAELTERGALVGTPAYMSPEQARGDPVDHRTDLFGLGAVMYRLCTGRPPFGGANVMAVLTALGAADPDPVRRLNPAVPESLARLVHQLLAKNPEHRPQTAAEVAKRLRAILDELLHPADPTVVAAAGAVPPAADVSASLPVVVNPLPDRPPVVVPMQVAARPADPFADLGAGEEEGAGEPAPAERARARETGGKGVLLGAGVAVLAVAVVAVVAAVMAVSPKGRTDRPAAEDKPPPVPAPVVRPAPAPPAPRPTWRALGPEWVDVLAADEALADAPAGGVGWQKRAGKWVAPAVPGKFVVTSLPLRVAGSYNVVASVALDSGYTPFSIALPVGERMVAFDFNLYGGTALGFSFVKGASANSPKNPTHTPRPPIPVGQVSKVSLSVALAAGRVELLAAVDDVPPIRWAGPVSDLGIGEVGFVPGRIGLFASGGGQWTVHALKFQKVDGEAAVREWAQVGP